MSTINRPATRHVLRTGSLVAACLLVAGGQLSAQTSRPVVGRLLSPAGTLFNRSKPGQDWQTPAADGDIHAEDLLVGLPGAVLSTGKGALSLTLLTDLDGDSPDAVIESAVVLHAATDCDLDFTLDRGRVAVVNLKKKGAARVRIRFHEETWEAKLTEPGARIALQLAGRWARGVPFREQPPAEPEDEDVPDAELLFVVCRGQVEIHHENLSHLLVAPPGPALLRWDNSDEPEEAPKKIESLPAWTRTPAVPPRDGPMEKLRRQVLRSSPRQAARAFVKSEDAGERNVGVRLLGALDDLEALAEVLTATTYPDTWEHAVVVARHWLGRGAGQDAILHRSLLAQRGLKPAQATGIVQLLHSFGEEELARPEQYTTLVRLLGSSSLTIRGLAHWHLVRLVPAGKKLGYNPFDPGDRRDKARAAWKKQIDDRIARHELPPRPPAK